MGSIEVNENTEENIVRNLKVPEIKEIREMEIESKLLVEKLPSYRKAKESDKNNIIIEEQNEDFLNSDFFDSKTEKDSEKTSDYNGKKVTSEPKMQVFNQGDAKPEIEFNFDESDEEKKEEKQNEKSFDSIFKKKSNSNQTSFKDRFGAKLKQAVKLDSDVSKSDQKPFIIKKNGNKSLKKMKKKAPRRQVVSVSQDITKARNAEKQHGYANNHNEADTIPLKPMFQKKRKISKNKNPEKGPIIDKKNNKNDILLAANEAEFEPVFKCNKGCGKSFKKSSLKKHEKICEKIFLSKRTPYNISKKRSVSQPQNPQGKKQPHKKGGGQNSKSKSSWKEKSTAFRENLKKKALMNTTGTKLEDKENYEENAPKPIHNSSAAVEK